MKNKELLENVKHFTKVRPFSIHKTEIGADSTNALYVHYHPEMEFIYLDEGSMTFYVEGKQYNMKEGDALFIPPALVHNAVKIQVCRAGTMRLFFPRNGCLWRIHLREIFIMK